jgi:hypothetical protein
VLCAGIQQRAATEAVADGAAAGDVGGIDDARDFIVKLRVAVAGPVFAVAHAAEIGRDHAVVHGQPGRDEIPPVRMRQEAMQQQQRGCTVGPRPFKIMHADAGHPRMAGLARAGERTRDESIE